ncbi:thioesterase II family protein [Kitasatospora sp. NBC_01266]|uniref:thioesterase II family protein n=1 Tax=Kitasatospora sp. NBC_01266 TaxID=2903572 RepID=UPI002E32BAA4|nr:alpha/beta fold hydrolase [Kitasatospora sp. NBC_01266]
MLEPLLEPLSEPLLEPLTSVPSGGLRLFLFPHAGGSGPAFQDWRGHLPPHWRVTALDAPGHGARLRDPLITDGDALVGHFLDRLGPELDGSAVPFAFFGHSMGALVAYELTRRLVAAGRTAPVWLGISACGAPGPDGPPVPVSPGGLSDAELLDRITRLGGTPPQLLAEPRLWRLFTPIIRADLQLLANWRPAPVTEPLPVPVSVFGGARDQVTGRPELARWAQRCDRFLGLRIFPGDHFYYQDDLPALAAAIEAGVRLATAVPAAQ